ncbi:MAG: phosphoribosylanthranilate isomerase [Chloroflexota bacterium]
MTVVKICGLRRSEDALVAARAGADLLGLVFAPSRRQVDERAALDIVTRVRQEFDARMVGVFVNAPASEMNRLAAACDLDYVQLSGDEGEDVVEALDVPAIQVVHVGPGMTSEVLNQRAAETSADLVLLDAKNDERYGGSGTSFDWTIVRAVQRPVLVAGGLDAGNVAEAVRIADPWGVDVSSGVERDGKKDHAQIKSFIEAARAPR